MRKVITSILALICASTAFSQTIETRIACHEIIQSGDNQVGLQFAFGSFNTADTEFMLILDDMTAKANYSLFAPSVAHAYAPNKVVGARFTYAKAAANLDNLTVSLLGDGMAFDFSDYAGAVSSIGGALFHRTYYGIDKAGVFGFYTETALAYSRMGVGFSADFPEERTVADRVKVAFNPGFVVFPMKNVSMNVSVSMADISYTSTRSFKAGETDGSRKKIGARYGLDLMGISFGLNIHI